MTPVAARPNATLVDPMLNARTATNAIRHTRGDTEMRR
jgi:hypothetical protein